MIEEPEEERRERRATAPSIPFTHVHWPVPESVPRRDVDCIAVRLVNLEARVTALEAAAPARPMLSSPDDSCGCPSSSYHALAAPPKGSCPA